MGHSLDGWRNREAGQANAAYNVRVYWRSLAVSSLAKLCAAGITDVIDSTLPGLWLRPCSARLSRTVPTGSIHSRDSFSLRPRVYVAACQSAPFSHNLEFQPQRTPGIRAVREDVTAACARCYGARKWMWPIGQR